MPEIEQKRASFKGLSVGGFETRKKPELEVLLKKYGGIPHVVSVMREVSLEKWDEMSTLEKALKSNTLDGLILFSAPGATRLFEILEKKWGATELKALFSKIPIVTRGDKPAEALSPWDLKPSFVVEDPSTWRGILKLLDSKFPVAGKTIAVQEYSEPNRIFTNELVFRGAEIIPIQSYRTELPEDLEEIESTLQEIRSGQIPVLLMTNSHQVNHLMMVARKKGWAQDLRRVSLSGVVASIGPQTTLSLLRHGIDVDLEAEKPTMEMLVEKAARLSQGIIESKKKRPSQIQFPENQFKVVADPSFDSIFLKACRKEPTSRTPIWLMRQAGRYMKEYRELRSKVSFIELCKNSDLASEVTVDAAHRLGVDAAIIFSDILMIVEPLGFHLSYGKDQGPVISNPFEGSSDLKKVKKVDPHESLYFVFEAIRKTRKALKPGIPLIGFAGSPFTVASYIIEGKTSKTFDKTKRLMLGDPKGWHTFMDNITIATIDYLNEQVKAGAQVIQLFDSWVGCLTPEDFREYVLPYSQRITQGIKPGIPVINFGTQTTGILPLFKEIGGDVFGVDWRIELDEAWDILGDVAIQGNLDPVVLLTNQAEIRHRADRILNQAKGRPGHIFNLGHGVLPKTPIENVISLIEYVKEKSQRG